MIAQTASSAATIVLVTGGNQGLGFESVKKLAAEQANFNIILCSRDIERGKVAVESLSVFKQDTTVEGLELNVDEDESIAQAVEYVEQKYGRLDGELHFQAYSVWSYLNLGASTLQQRRNHVHSRREKHSQ